jgi:hypothetical protein
MTQEAHAPSSNQGGPSPGLAAWPPLGTYDEADGQLTLQAINDTDMRITLTSTRADDALLLASHAHPARPTESASATANIGDSHIFVPLDTTRNPEECE